MNPTKWHDWARRLAYTALPNYSSQPFPNATDELVEEFLQAFRSQSAEGKVVLGGFGQQHSSTLTLYADHAASLAVRYTDLSRLRLALLSAGIAYELHEDYRDVLPSVDVCRDAAERLGSNLWDLVKSAPATDNAALKSIATLPKDWRAHADLWEMGYEATFPREGFVYRLMSIDEIEARMNSQS